MQRLSQRISDDTNLATSQIERMVFKNLSFSEFLNWENKDTSNEKKG